MGSQASYDASPDWYKIHTFSETVRQFLCFFLQSRRWERNRRVGIERMEWRIVGLRESTNTLGYVSTKIEKRKPTPAYCTKSPYKIPCRFVQFSHWQSNCCSQFRFRSKNGMNKFTIYCVQSNCKLLYIVSSSFT